MQDAVQHTWCLPVNHRVSMVCCSYCLQADEQAACATLHWASCQVAVLHDSSMLLCIAPHNYSVVNSLHHNHLLCACIDKVHCMLQCSGAVV
jgi:hypothetical protein